MENEHILTRRSIDRNLFFSLQDFLHRHTHTSFSRLSPMQKTNYTEDLYEFEKKVRESPDDHAFRKIFLLKLYHLKKKFDIALQIPEPEEEEEEGV